MDPGGEVARTTTVESTDLGLGMASAVQGGEAHMTTGTFHGQLGAAAAGRVSFDGFEPSAAAYHNIGASWRQLALVDVVLVDPQLPGGVVPVYHNYGYSALQPRPGAGRGMVLVDLLPDGGGAVYNGEYAVPVRPGAGHGEVLVDLLPDGAGHGEVFVGLLPGGVDAAYDNYGYYAPGAGHGEVLVDLLRDGAGHGEVFIGLLPGGGGAVHDDYGYNPWQWQPRSGAGRGEVFIGPLPDCIGVVFDGSGNFARHTLPALGTRGADRIAGALGGPNLGVVAKHLRRLLPFAGIAASSVAVNGLAAGPASPAVAFHLFVLLLGGLFLVILHVLRV